MIFKLIVDDYVFDKDLYMISINGYKVNYEFIENINNHRFRLTKPYTEIIKADDPYPRVMPKVLLYRFLQPDQLLSRLYSYSDKWSDAVDCLSPKSYENLLIEHTKV